MKTLLCHFDAHDPETIYLYSLDGRFYGVGKRVDNRADDSDRTVNRLSFGGKDGHLYYKIDAEKPVEPGMGPAAGTC